MMAETIPEVVRIRRAQEPVEERARRLEVEVLGDADVLDVVNNLGGLADAYDSETSEGSPRTGLEGD